jgi:hypothetical protein
VVCNKRIRVKYWQGELKMFREAGKASRRLLKIFTVVVLPLILLLSLCLPAQADEPGEDNSTGIVDDSPGIVGEYYVKKVDQHFLDQVSNLTELNQSANGLGAGSTTLFSDGFEGTFPGTKWNVFPKSGYAWDTTTYKKLSGSKSVWCAASELNPSTSNYPSGMYTELVTGPFDLSDAESGELGLSLWLKTQVPTSSDIHSGDIFGVMAYAGTGDYIYGYAYSSQAAAWGTISKPLNNWNYWGDLCGNDAVYFIFSFESNTDAVTDKGAFVDDVKLTVDIAAGEAPEPPSGLWAEAVSSSQVNLEWDDNSDNETGFKLERMKEGDAGFKEIAKPKANVTAYTDKSGLKAYTTYYYRISAYNAEGNSEYSDETDVTTLSEPPSPPVLASPKNGATKLGQNPVLSWNPPKTGTAELYNVQIADESTFLEPLVEDEVYEEISYEVNDDLEWNTKYYWRVNASGYEGSTSDWSKVFNFKTAAGPPPEEPYDLEANAVSSKQVYLTWGDGSENETGFYLERKKEGDAGFKKIATLKADVIEYTDTKSLTALTTYFYRICAYNSVGSSNYSEEVEVTTLTEPPSAPVLSSPKNGATKQGMTPELAWNAPKKGEAEFYSLQIAIDSKFVEINLYEEYIGDLNFDVPYGNLEWNTKYFWRVSATNIEGSTSAWSKAFNFKTAAGPPPEPPSDLIAEVVASQQVQLDWYDNSEDETGFYLECKKSTETKFKQIAKLGPDIDEYLDESKLSADTDYDYRICAYNSYGSSAYSEIATITTWPAPPKAPTLTSPANKAKLSDLIPELTWKAPTGSKIDFYDLQVATDTGFEDCWVDEEGIGDLFYQIDDGTLDYNTTYYWHVRAVVVTDDMDLTSDWSSYRQFKTPVEPAEE